MPSQRRLVNFTMTVGGTFSSDAGSDEEAIKQLMNKSGTDLKALLDDVHLFIDIDEESIVVQVVEDD